MPIKTIGIIFQWCFKTQALWIFFCVVWGHLDKWVCWHDESRNDTRRGPENLLPVPIWSPDYFPSRLLRRLGRKLFTECIRPPVRERWFPGVPDSPPPFVCGIAERWEAGHTMCPYCNGKLHSSRVHMFSKSMHTCAVSQQGEHARGVGHMWISTWQLENNTLEHTFHELT